MSIHCCNRTALAAGFTTCMGKRKRAILIDPLTNEELQFQRLDGKAVTRTQRYTHPHFKNIILWYCIFTVLYVGLSSLFLAGILKLRIRSRGRRLRWRSRRRGAGIPGTGSPPPFSPRRARMGWAPGAGTTSPPPPPPSPPPPQPLPDSHVRQKSKKNICKMIFNVTLTCAIPNLILTLPCK